MFGKKKNYEKNTSIMENDDVMINDKKAKVNEYLDSMEYMSKVVLEKKEALADEEIKSITEIDKVKGAYEAVLNDNRLFSETIADFGEWSIVEEYGSERTIQESERILRYCNERERRNRKIEAKRKEEIESNITAALLGAISVGVPGIMFILWLLEII